MDDVMVERSFLLEKAKCVPADLLEEILLFVQTGLPRELVTDDLLFKSKYVLIELITNALKHSNSNNAYINLELSDKQIRFVKVDDGDKLSIPVKHDDFKAGYIVTSDVMHTLYAIDRDDKMHFYCQENNEFYLDAIIDLPEHFGLLVITKASDEFYYTHNASSKLNTFSVTINL